MDFCSMPAALAGPGGLPGPRSRASSFSLRSDRSLLMLESESRLEDWRPLSSRLNFWDWLWSKVPAGASSFPPGQEPDVEVGLSRPSCSSLGLTPSLCGLWEKAGTWEEELGEGTDGRAAKGEARIPFGGSAMVNRFGLPSEAAPALSASVPEKPPKGAGGVASP